MAYVLKVLFIDSVLIEHLLPLNISIKLTDLFI